MNGTHSKSIPVAQDRWLGALADYWRGFQIKKNAGNFAIVATGLALLFLLVLLKSKTTVDFAVEPFLYIYSMFVTAFYLSRLVTAMFYESSCQSVVDPKLNPAAAEFEPPVSIIIPCKNEEDDIANTVSQCFAAEYPRDLLEVIVVNDGSTDNTSQVLKELEKKYARLIVAGWEINRGKRQAMAEGFRLSSGEIVIQLDSDSYIEPKTFRNIIIPFAEPSIAAVCAHGDPANAGQNILTKMQAAYYFMSFRILKAAESAFMSVFCCSGCSSAYRKSAVLPLIESWVGEKFWGLPVTWGDDRALTSWVLKAGYKTIYTDHAKALTIVPETLKKLLKQQLRWKKSWFINAFFTGKFIWKSQPFVAAFYFFPLILVSFATPIMCFRSLVWAPLTHGIYPYYHIGGVLLFTGLVAAYYRLLSRENKYWPYLFLWSLLNLFVLSFLMFWAVVKIQDRGWGTR